MKLAENIYKYRTSRNWSQTDLANELEVSRQSVSKWENNSAVPDLERLIKMSIIFDITIDDLVFGTTVKVKAKENDIASINFPPTRIMSGLALLIFGMIFFLLSIFWGNNLYFGEEFGELLSITLVILSLSLIATDNFAILGICAVIYFAYTFISFGFVHVTSMTSYIFTFISSVIILVWFIVYGTRATKGEPFHPSEAISSDLNTENDNVKSN